MVWHSINFLVAELDTEILVNLYIEHYYFMNQKW